MKRLAIVFLTFTVLLCLFACNAVYDSDSETTDGESVTVEETTVEETTVEETTDKV